MGIDLRSRTYPLSPVAVCLFLGTLADCRDGESVVRLSQFQLLLVCSADWQRYNRNTQVFITGQQFSTSSIECRKWQTGLFDLREMLMIHEDTA
jgi:hypothetical protein